MKSNHTKQTVNTYQNYPLVIVYVILCIIFSSLSAMAQPSGGPYGPIRQSYDLPKVSGQIYYVAPDGQAEASGKTLAQPTTLTGSIGIWGGKLVSRGVYAKLKAGRETVSRGKAAGMYADTAPFDDDERAKLRANIGNGYARFKDRVAQGRTLSVDEVEAIARGRVWTGEQALERGLVDVLGDLRDAAERARQLAGVSPRRYTPLVDLTVPKQVHLAQATPTDAAAWLEGLKSLLREGVYALAPWSVRIHD